MKKKLIGTDLDGTLLSDEERNGVKVRIISKRNARAIQQLLNQGHIVVPVTARHPENVLALLEQASLPRLPIIGASGAQILDENGSSLRESLIDREQLKSVIEHLNRHDMTYFLLTSDGRWLYRESTTDDKREHDTRPREKIDGRFAEIDDNIIQVMAYTRYSEKKQKLVESIKSPQLSIASSNKNNIEIGPKEADKGEALQFFAKEKGIDLDNCIVFGDSLNDRSMFELIKSGGGRCFAMPDSPEELTKIATDDVKDNEDGVGPVMEKLAREWEINQHLTGGKEGGVTTEIIRPEGRTRGI